MMGNSPKASLLLRYPYHTSYKMKLANIPVNLDHLCLPRDDPSDVCVTPSPSQLDAFSADRALMLNVQLFWMVRRLYLTIFYQILFCMVYSNVWMTACIKLRDVT